MATLKTLVLMQLKDKIDVSFLKDKKQTIFKVVLGILKFVLITAVIYLAFYILSYLRLVSLLPGIPDSVFAIIFSVMIILSIIVCTFGLTKSLYFAKDNFVLLTMPVGKGQVFLSKLLVYLIFEFTRNINYMLPLFLAYGFINKMPLYFYPWLIIVLIIVTIVPVSIGALLSIPLLCIENVVKSYKWLEYLIVACVILGVSAGLIYLISIIPTNFDLVGTWGTTFWQIQAFITRFNEIFLPFAIMSKALIGTRYGISNTLFSLEQFLSMLGIIGAVAIIFGLAFVIVRPLYFKMASTPFEYKKNSSKKQHVNKKSYGLFSTIKKDMIVTYRTPEKFYTLISIVIGLPLSIFLLNKIYSAMDTRLAGTNMAIAFNVLLILLISMSSNTSMAHVISEEGGASYLLKTSPKPYLKSILSKLTLTYALMIVSLVITTIIFASFLKIKVIETILIILAVILLYTGQMLYSVELDVMNSQTQKFQTEGINSFNPNDLKSTIMGLVLSVIIAFATYFLIGENMYTVWYKIFGISLIYLIFRIYMFTNKVNVYFKERE